MKGTKGKGKVNRRVHLPRPSPTEFSSLTFSFFLVYFVKIKKIGYGNRDLMCKKEKEKKDYGGELLIILMFSANSLPVKEFCYLRTINLTAAVYYFYKENGG